jgi:hypothetical protein
MKALGAMYRDGLLSWALLERTIEGWAFADGGLHEGATLREALQRAGKRFPKMRPRVGVEWGAVELFAANNESKRELSSAIRIETGERDRIVEVFTNGPQRIVAHAPRSHVASAVEPWRACGIDPLSAEPLEIAWLRTTGWNGAVLNLMNRPAYLLIGREGRIERYRIDRSGDDDYQSIVLLIRRARNEIGLVERIVVLGSPPPGLLGEEAGVGFEEFSVIGIASPPWSDALALATGGWAREFRALARTTRKLFRGDMQIAPST